MSQVYDMYRIVRTIQKEVRRMDKLEPQPITDAGFDVWHVASSNVMHRFIKRRPWLVATDSAHIIADCIVAGYLLRDSVSDSFESKMDVLTITKSGRKLIERTWFIFPTGLWRAWHEDNGKFFTGLMTTVVALLAAIITLLAKITLFR